MNFLRSLCGKRHFRGCHFNRLTKENAMSCTIIQRNIQTVLEEASAVYSMVCDSTGQPNTDYAGYACHTALNRFRSLLGDPNLSASRLEYLLRKAARQHAKKDPNGDWSHFMAGYISNSANTNQNGLLKH